MNEEGKILQGGKGPTNICTNHTELPTNRIELSGRTHAETSDIGTVEPRVGWPNGRFRCVI